jgi:hypothetical protein
MQVLNVVTFARWKCPGQTELIESLHMVSVGIMNRLGAKQSQRYWGKNFPEFQVVAKKVHAKCTEFVRSAGQAPVSPADRKTLQQLLIVGFQVLLPPMRGKPFYTLSKVDNGKNSMGACLGNLVSQKYTFLL